MTEIPTSNLEGLADVEPDEKFPGAEITSALKDELLANVTMQAEMSGVPLPTDQAKLVNQQVAIDSLIAVEILCVVDAFVGFEIKAEGVVRPGGYNSVNEAVSHMLPRIEKAWRKEKSIGRKK